MIKAGILLIACGVFALLAFHGIGASVDAQGFLHEAFALLPTGIILLVAGLLVVLIAYRRRASARSAKLP